MSSAVITSVDAAGVRRAMDDYASWLLAARADVEEIVVFGSFADGRWAPESDLDVLIVLSESALPIRERTPTLLPDAFPVPVDVFALTRAELAERAASALFAGAAASRWRYHRRAVPQCPDDPATQLRPA